MKKSTSIASLLAAGLSMAAMSALAAGGASDPAQLSLEDLMQIEVTSVSKKPQRLANVAAAVHVITAEDIRLSGANSLPEALRLAPGVDATRSSANRWAVSTRAFSEVFAEKLLVLVDGRSAFNPAFSGVLWQDFQFPLEDIERIEVIRGPAASVWGSNGMNGVINIITKSAAATQGGQAVVGGGTVEGSYGRARWGGQNSDGSVFYRVYGSTQDGRAQIAAPALGGGNGQDSFGYSAAGMRLDGYLSDGGRWDMSADLYSNRSNGFFYVPQPSGKGIERAVERHNGLSLRARYEKPLADGANLQFQAAYVQTDMTVPYAFPDERRTFDLDVQHRFRVGGRHDLVWGANYRVSSDTISPGKLMYMNMPSRRLRYVGLFAQDEISLAEAVRLTMGMRADHNPISGLDLQPTARLSWNLRPSQTVWGALSKVARAPSRAEAGFNRNYIYIPGDLAAFQPDTQVVLRGVEKPESEKLTAAELGLRSQWTPALSTDMVVFAHRYSNLLRTGGPQTVVPGFPLTVVNIEVGNGGYLNLNGAELAIDWRINTAWRAQVAQTWNNVTRSGPGPTDPVGGVPDSISSLRLSWTPDSKVSVDAWLRRTSARPGIPTRVELQRRAFTGVDLRVGWRPSKGVELSITGQNLNNGSCDAFAGLAAVSTNAESIPTCQPRSLVGQIRFDF